MSSLCVSENRAIADVGHLDDIKLASSKMLGAERRAFQAAMALKTSDFIVDCLYAWWERQSSQERDALSLLQIKG